MATAPSPPLYDVAVIGAGDVGAAIARELSRFDLRLALVEGGPDVGAGTSKANTAILHTGFDAKPGTLEARLVARGHALLSAYAEEAGVPLERTGALLVAWTPDELARLDGIAARARENGYARTRPVRAGDLYAREPHLGPGALGALEVPDEHIVCPWTPPLACATQAVLAGADLHRSAPVSALRRREGIWALSVPGGTLRARWVVNAAGLRSDEVHRMAGLGGFTVRPRRGELVVFDKLARPLVRHVLLPVPTATTKGVLIAPTVFGNVMLGPTAEDVAGKRDTASSAAGLDFLLGHGRRLMPALLEHEVTAVYAGLRAATEHADYVVEAHGNLGYAVAGGIRSTGLTGALAIAEHLAERMGEEGLALRERPGGLPEVRMANIGEAVARPYAQPERIAADPAYGEIVCFCERVTSGEVRDALAGPVPPVDADGLRRRTRVLMGRCQGFFCGARIAREVEDARA
jgi:glycerol-3-phosphate dehydrogenase